MHILKDENICKYMSISLQNLVEYWNFFQVNGGLNGDLLIYYVFSAFAYCDHNTWNVWSVKVMFEHNIH